MKVSPQPGVFTLPPPPPPPCTGHSPYPMSQLEALDHTRFFNRSPGTFGRHRAWGGGEGWVSVPVGTSAGMDC